MTPTSKILSLLSPSTTKSKQAKNDLKSIEELSSEINEHTFFLKLLETIKNDAKALKTNVSEILSKDEKTSSKPNLQDKINELKENILVAKEKITIKKEQKETKEKRLSDIIALAEEKGLNLKKIEIQKPIEDKKTKIESTKEHKIVDEIKNQTQKREVSSAQEILKTKEPQILESLETSKELKKELKKETNLKELLNLDPKEQKTETKSILKNQKQPEPTKELNTIEPTDVKNENSKKLGKSEQETKISKQIETPTQKLKNESLEAMQEKSLKESSLKEKQNRAQEISQKENPKNSQKSKTKPNTQEIATATTQRDEPNKTEITKKIDDKLQNQETKPKKSTKLESLNNDIKTQENSNLQEQLIPKELESKKELKTQKIEPKEELSKKQETNKLKEPKKVETSQKKEPQELEKKEANSPKNEPKIDESQKDQPKRVKSKNNQNNQEKNLEPTKTTDETQKKIIDKNIIEAPKKQIEPQTKEPKEITVATQSISTIQVIKETQIRIEQTKIEHKVDLARVATNQESKLKNAIEMLNQVQHDKMESKLQNKEIIAQIATNKLEADEKKIKQKEKPKEPSLASLFQKLEPEKAEKGLDKKIEQTEVVSILQGQKIDSQNLELLYKSAMAKETLKNVANELKERIDNYKPPVTKLSLELHPLELGKVDVTISTRGNNIVVQLTSNPAAINLFAQNQTEFKANLMALGFSDVSMQFSFNNHQNNQERNQRNANRLYKESLEVELIESEILEITIPRYI